ncbi:FMN-linked oxidoreductase [Cylindrobasidium torrendii FP15055 ss-10]|uniref:FMN-linked oxidoreductase n=1 Tax=Cylindrobasidium torrendii FP15055 ss-10 TaxID=1314674 RepID=A0A0D7BFB8_9AGAR|nr:FMN-linked oxidoreductase [Cylindrobasidium torrendii FP15055 ss-10]
MSSPTSNTVSIFAPLKLGPLTLKNRVGVAAMTRNRSVPTTVPNSINVEHYRQRAAGGAGLIITEAILIERQGTEWQHAPGIWSKEHVEGWKKVTQAVHAEGGLIYGQLWHTGRVSHPDAPEQIKAGKPVYAPSAIRARGGKFRFIEGVPGYATPTAIEDPATFIPIWKQAAVNAKEAGFDGVQVHGSNGYLVHQFLDSSSNQRTDQWGGSIQNRARFGLEVLKALIDVWGAERVAIKLSPGNGYNDMGMPLEETLETYSYFITEADKLRLAFIELVRYTEFGDPVIDGTRRGTPHDVIGSYAPLIKRSAKFGNAGYSSEEAAQAVARGELDGVFFGMLSISNPDLARRFEHGKEVNTNLDMVNLYGNGESLEELEKGYNDYPIAVY